MKLHLLVAISLALACCVVHVAARDAEELMNAEHWDDIYFEGDGSGHARFDGFLALYAPSCERKLDQMKFGQGLPPLNYVLTARYDYESRKKQAWYQFDDYDLKKRFSNVGCPHIMYFPRDNHTQIQVWNQKGTFSDWAWSKMSVQVQFYNEHHGAANIMYRGANGEDTLLAIVEPETRATINTYISHKIYAIDVLDNTFLGGWDVRREHTHSIQTLAFSEDPKAPTRAGDWMKGVHAANKAEHGLITSEIWSHTRRHIMFSKQPPLVPAYTRLGYAKMPQPPNVFKALREYFDANTGRRRVENWHKGATQINFDFVKTAMIDLPDNIKRLVASEIQPVLEKWSGQKLSYQMMYGIREYYNGSILRKHVDRLETHVISVILNVHQDVDEDWVLEVVDFEGRNVRIPQKAGEMVLYESARLQHGRPYPLKGRSYASAFLHYMPVEGWNGIYTFTDDNVIHVNGPNPQHIPLRPESLHGIPYQGSPVSNVNRDDL